MDRVISIFKYFVRKHKEVFNIFMEKFNLDEYELSWVSFMCGSFLMYGVLLYL